MSRSANNSLINYFELLSFAAVVIDPENWKGHWRKGVALMAMSKRQFRTKQAIEAFESCRKCPTLPADKKAEVVAELSKARARMEQQDAEVSGAVEGISTTHCVCAK